MKLACVDKSAVERLALQRVFQDAYESCKASIGHIALFSSYPASKEELLFSSAPDIIAIGSGFGAEDALTTCRELRRCFPDTPIFIFLKPEVYTLRVLQRFREVAQEIFTVEESAIRIIDRLSLYDITAKRQRHGKVIVVQGVKGGVGATSVVSGLAHAAEALGQNAITIDLSVSSALVQYMAAQRWHSPDYSALLSEGIIPDKTLVERCITTAPNGINVLLPPSGGTDVREQWLRDPNRFETSLAIVDVLTEMYNLVIVDTAGVEGVLPFALNTRAHSRVLVTSNDPASVHLLNCQLTQGTETPGDANIHVLVNLLHEALLNKEDVLDFLYTNPSFTKEMALLNPIPFDAKARNWIGTGNTFYTEGSMQLQAVLERALEVITWSKEELTAQLQPATGFLGNLRKLSWTQSLTQRKNITAGIKALPFLGKTNTQSTQLTLQAGNYEHQTNEQSYGSLVQTEIVETQDDSHQVSKLSNVNVVASPLPQQSTSTPISLTAVQLDGEAQTSAGAQLTAADLYQPPQLVTDNIGGTS